MSQLCACVKTHQHIAAVHTQEATILVRGNILHYFIAAMVTLQPCDVVSEENPLFCESTVFDLFVYYHIPTCHPSRQTACHASVRTKTNFGIE